MGEREGVGWGPDRSGVARYVTKNERNITNQQVLWNDDHKSETSEKDSKNYDHNKFSRRAINPQIKSVHADKHSLVPHLVYIYSTVPHPTTTRRQQTH